VNVLFNRHDPRTLFPICAFLYTNPGGITSGLPVTREQSPVMSTNQTCGVRAYMRAAEALQKSLHVNASLFF